MKRPQSSTGSRRKVSTTRHAADADSFIVEQPPGTPAGVVEGTRRPLNRKSSAACPVPGHAKTTRREMRRRFDVQPPGTRGGTLKLTAQAGARRPTDRGEDPPVDHPTFHIVKHPSRRRMTRHEGLSTSAAHLRNLFPERTRHSR